MGIFKIKKTIYSESIFLVMVFTVIFFACWSGDAVEAMSSANYEVTGDTISIGGGNSSSASYVAEDTFGDIASGEDLQSANYSGCSGFQCVDGSPYISFSVKEGTSKPGVEGTGVALGSLSTSSVTTSDGVGVNSVFVLTETSADNGLAVGVISTYSGLKRFSTSDIISSSSATLSAGSEGYGVCVGSAAEDLDSPDTLSASAPYDGVCNKVNGHDVGLVDGTLRTIVDSSGQIKGGDIEILVKASISPVSAAGNDYIDTLTFIATGTY
ncbi:hypothetical protein A2480_04630 [Candidatus Uhrbacteria bacterium RIFOXYC2_FULL_47_19]|uniref:Uncharacterized protein n=1 Tax=Candidatus Uhrbacteria bacterium RIFOXYC2_FULL_47_19 TaxID=1802424 RepID=A0A1F7WD04_9BACT|nr:MAG: hypothetical protein A2480_04630 [Candidatus Uhrbacteria bacterium RIFOXYC2_FULL_47_19]